MSYEIVIPTSGRQSLNALLGVIGLRDVIVVDDRRDRAQPPLSIAIGESKADTHRSGSEEKQRVSAIVFANDGFALGIVNLLDNGFYQDGFLSVETGQNIHRAERHLKIIGRSAGLLLR